jgi:hypothetical protein
MVNAEEYVRLTVIVCETNCDRIKCMEKEVNFGGIFEQILLKLMSEIFN